MKLFKLNTILSPLIVLVILLQTNSVMADDATDKERILNLVKEATSSEEAQKKLYGRIQNRLKECYSVDDFLDLPDYNYMFDFEDDNVVPFSAFIEFDHDAKTAKVANPPYVYSGSRRPKR